MNVCSAYYTYPFYWASEVCIVIGRASIMKPVYFVLIHPHTLKVDSHIHFISVLCLMGSTGDTVKDVLSAHPKEQEKHDCGNDKNKATPCDSLERRTMPARFARFPSFDGFKASHHVSHPDYVFIACIFSRCKIVLGRLEELQQAWPDPQTTVHT